LPGLLLILSGFVLCLLAPAPWPRIYIYALSLFPRSFKWTDPQGCVPTRAASPLGRGRANKTRRGDECTTEREEREREAEREREREGEREGGKDRKSTRLNSSHT